MRKPLIAGNWKMNGSIQKTKDLVQALKRGAPDYPEIEVLICPPYLFLQQAKEYLSSSTIQLGAQNLYPGTEGAFTGEISGEMLFNVGCRYVLIGHSERRTLFEESLELIASKCKAALAARLTPILCVGESESERAQGLTEQVIESQLNSVIKELESHQLQNLIIAYEPVWAIGTGLTAKPEQAQTVHAFIRKLIGKNTVDLAAKLRILYGGSMKADNASALLSMPDIDGGLIGGASLDANHFLSICAAANVRNRVTQ